MTRPGQHRKLIKAFLSVKRYEIGIYVGLMLTFGSLFILGRLPLEFYFYGVLFTGFFFLGFLLFHFFRYQKRYRSLEYIESQPLAVLRELETSIDPSEKYILEEIEFLLEQLTEEKLLQQEKNTEQMDYFTLWLHQIKTPIAAMSLLVQQNQENPLLTKKVRQELIRVEDYTHMALNYLKLDQTGKELNLGEVDLDQLIKKALKKFSILFIYNRISLDYQPLQQTVLSDEKWLFVLVEQILSNSLKYTPEQGVIKIYMEPDQENQLIIEDSGIGIRSEDLPKIFEKGYSGWNGKIQEKSTGLGLFLSKKICQRLGHKLDIQSRLGQGTVVRINLKQEKLEIF
ncbi:sensor histidine kinase [Desemzia sp. RIT804]|uniref:sensor histidine kinase n=1 Tax=Desemzia sp. RIT 804 TaxID=2810209 RepID=UPI00195126E8|nr:sensor histidine kinase [Desemzia sp. RIT 804]MBM6614349.1 sensor histidine kinase [Desemzia sp. RIT 804]